MRDILESLEISGSSGGNPSLLDERLPTRISFANSVEASAVP
jgi:hypothetical protein